MSTTTIPSFNMRDLSHDHLRSLSSSSVSVWDRSESTPPVIRLAIDGINDALPIHLKVMHRDNSSEYKQITGAADGIRDKAFSLFSRKVFAATEEWDEMIAAAARKIHEVLLEHGKKLVKLSYSQQSERTKQIVELLSTEEYLGYINLIGLSKDFARVAETNNEFLQKWDERLDSEISDEDLPHLKAIRSDLESDLRTLLSMTEYLFSKGHTSVSENMIEKMAAHVSEITRLVDIQKSQDEE